MRLILRFLKPHWRMCVLTVFLLFVDVVGALIIPTFAAELMNEAEKGMAFSWDESVLDYLVEKSYSLTYGARNLRRTIQKDIEDRMAEVIVDQRRGGVKAMRLTAADGKINVEAE